MGRFEGVARAERVCPHCEGGLEDVRHVLFECPLYTSSRDRFPDLLGYGGDASFAQQFNWGAATHPDDAGTVRRARERLFGREMTHSDDQIRLRVREDGQVRRQGDGLAVQGMGKALGMRVAFVQGEDEAQVCSWELLGQA